MKSDLQRFDEKVLVVESGCHEWQSTVKKDGYGKFWFRHRQEPAHRAAYTLKVAEIPQGMLVLHKCDNRKCVNPDHLYIGNQKQNVLDKIERCPWWGNMKHPYEIVQECKRLYAETDMTQMQIAEKLNIKQIQVSRYIRGAQRKTR